ncbi:MAG: hypothetical protein ACXW1C_01860 [Gallionella sp.]
MSQSTIQSNWARFAFIVLAMLWATAGWFILWNGGFYTTQKHTHVTSLVDGWGAVFMGYLFLLLAAVTLAVVLQSFAVRRNAYVALVVLMFVPPAWLLIRSYA